jgi:hypothetical protein
MVTPDTPQEVAAAIRLGSRRLSAAVVGPPSCGKTTALAHVVRDAITCGMCLPSIAVFAHSRAAARGLRQMIAEAWPELTPHELFDRGKIGIPLDAASAHSWFKHERVTEHRDYVRAAGAFCALIKVVGGLGEDLAAQAFLAERQEDIVEAIRFDIDSRLHGRHLPRIAWLHEIADFFKAYKAREELADIADIYRHPICGDESVELLVIDEVNEDERTILRRCFPRARTVTASRTPIAADQVIELTRPLREPERIEIVDDVGSPRLVPHNLIEGTLMIVVANPARWRMPHWRHWCDDAGLHPRIGSRPLTSSWRAVVGAWRIDHGAEVNAHEVVPLLRAAGLQLGRADIPGFTNWREVCKGDPREVRRAEAVLERYGRLVDLPDHRILTPKQARGREADTVIVDRTSGIFSDGDLATAMSRARRKLIVVRKLK